MESIQLELIMLAITLVASALGYATRHVTKFLKNKGIITKLQANKELVSIGVSAVEQMYKNVLHGDEKLNMAKIEIVKLAKEKGIKISEREINLLIESSVREMNQAIKEEVKKK